MQFENIEKIGSEESFLSAKMALIVSMTFLGVSYGVILLLWFFIVSDTILGVAKEIALYGWEGVTGRRFWAGVLTKLAILFIPFSLALAAALLGYNLNIFVMTAMYALIANDAISCYTNILSIKKKRNYVNKDLVELLINTLRALIYNSVKSGLNKLKESDMCSDEEIKKKEDETNKKL